MGMSTWDYVTILPNIGFALSKIGYAAISSPLRSADQAKTISEHIQRKTFLALFSSFTVTQLQLIMPPFQSVYSTYCKKQKLTPNIVSPIPGTNISGFWLGDPSTAKLIIIYHHGGGFVLPGLEPHLEFQQRLITATNSTLAIFSHCYSLAPTSPYPQAISESISTLSYITSTYPSTPLALAGDSAGGNLVATVLSHISGHPHPQSSLVRPFTLPTPLAGSLLIAPWVSNDSSKFASIRQLGHLDVINEPVGLYWASIYAGGAPKDEWMWPELADSAWWKGCKGTAGKVLITAGENEVLRDAIVGWAKKFEGAVGKGKVKLVVGKEEIHDHPMMDLRTSKEMDGMGETTQAGAIYNWVKELI